MLQNLQEQGDRLRNTEDNLTVSMSVDRDVARKLKDLRQAKPTISITNSFPVSKRKREGDT
jgi:hypothetical protein